MSGPRVVVTRPADRAAATAEALRGAGAEPIVVPLIEISDPPSWDALDRAAAEVTGGTYDWIVFTSVHAVSRFAPRLTHPVSARIAAVGPATASALGAAGVTVDLVPESPSGEHLSLALGRGTGRVLLPRVEEAPRQLPETLRHLGWDPHELAAYRNVAAAVAPAELSRLRGGGFDAVIFASGSAARNFVSAVSAPADLGLAGPPGERGVIVAGDTTAAAAADAGFRIDVVAPSPDDEGLAVAVSRWWATQGMGR